MRRRLKTGAGGWLSCRRVREVAAASKRSESAREKQRGKEKRREKGREVGVDRERVEGAARHGRGRFFPIKQPAEFVFSPKRRCRFKVIDCHPGGHGLRGGGLSRGNASQDVSVYGEKEGRGGRIGTSCAVARFVPFRFASSPFRYVTLRLLGRASPRAI